MKPKNYLTVSKATMNTQFEIDLTNPDARTERLFHRATVGCGHTPQTFYKYKVIRKREQKLPGPHISPSSVYCSYRKTNEISSLYFFFFLELVTRVTSLMHISKRRHLSDEYLKKITSCLSAFNVM